MSQSRLFGRLAPIAARSWPLRTLAVAGICLATVTGSATSWAQDEPDTDVYRFELELAPVCLDGAFPLSIQTDAGDVQGDAQLTTDAAGKLSGQIDLDGVTFELKGKVRYRPNGHKVQLTGKSATKDRIALKGNLDADEFVGTAKGKGTVAQGKNPFSLDVSGAAPQMALFVMTLEPGKKSFGGHATVEVCGGPIDLGVKGKMGKKLTLQLKQRGRRGFRWTGKGAAPAGDTLNLMWSASGYGAKTAAADPLLLTAIVPPSNLAYVVTAALYETDDPIAPNTATIAGDAVDTWSVDPALPPGLTLNLADGTITGTPTTPTATDDYDVTAENLAGKATATLSLGVRLNRAKDLSPYTGPMDDDAIAHFLGRTHFGVTAAKKAELQADGLSTFVDDMFVFPTNTQVEADAFQLLVNSGDPGNLQGKFPSDDDLAEWVQYLMTRTEDPFQEQLALFWQDHFGVSSEVLGSSERHWMVDYINLLRRDGAGNFKQLMRDISRDPAMLEFLDGNDNRDGRANENYAREFWELFTLGVDNGYTQVDIEEASRAFTGWRQRFNDTTELSFVEFDPGRHDDELKVVLGVSIPGQDVTDDYDAVIDITFDTELPAAFIVHKLFEWFCFTEPDQTVVDQLAQQLIADNWDMEPVLKTMLQSEAFFSPKARGAFVKNPVDYAVGFIRSTGLHVLDLDDLDDALIDMGMRPTEPPSVDGWPSGVYWLSPQPMVNRTNLVNEILGDTNNQRNAGIEVADILPPVPQRTADAVVDTLCELLSVEMTPQDRTEMIDYLNTERQNDGTVQPSPFDGSDQDHLDERVRGALLILAQHPTYHVR